jgi:hypothetical protein
MNIQDSIRKSTKSNGTQFPHIPEKEDKVNCMKSKYRGDFLIADSFIIETGAANPYTIDSLHPTIFKYFRILIVADDHRRNSVKRPIQVR